MGFHKKGGVRKATPSVTRGTPRVRAAKDDDVVRFRTFPSKTARHLMTTMALVMDHPRALITKKGGSVVLLDIPPEGEFSDGASNAGSSAGAVGDQAECRGNTLWRDVSGEEFSERVADCVVLPISSASVAILVPCWKLVGIRRRRESENRSSAVLIHRRVRWPVLFQSVCRNRMSRNSNAFSNRFKALGCVHLD